MKKLLLALIVVALLILGGYFLKDLFVKRPAGLEITTTPESTVYLNGENKGTTPFADKNIKPGSYTLRLVPIGGENFAPYETNLSLISKASTVISRDFSASDLDSSGYTLELQEDPAGNTYISIISDPDNVNIYLDDAPKGMTPHTKVPVNPGTHHLRATTPGYRTQEVTLNIIKGYNLIVNLKLAGETITLTSPTPATPSGELAPEPVVATQSSTATTPPELTPAKPYVTILETETGWLRVRADASGTSEELGKVDTGENLKYLGETTESGWHKIEFEGKPGWVSGKYVNIVK